MSGIVGNPQEFLKFMSTYALFLDDFGDSGIYWAKLLESKGGDGLPTTYRLANAGGEGRDHFKIYWCQYKKDKVFTVSLGREANIMFTPKMTGCSFAVGMPAPDGNIIVGHANVHNDIFDELVAIDKDMDERPQNLSQLMEIRRRLVAARQFQMLDQEFRKAKDPVIVKKVLDTTNAEYTASSSGIISFGILDAETTPTRWRFYFQTKDSGNNVTGIHKIKK